MPGIAALLAATLAAACAREPARPNLVLISLDTVRADRLGAYGYDRPTTPVLDAFAREAVVFERAYSTSNWTLPSHVSMLSGLYPVEHGVLRLDQAIGAEVELLPETLAKRGYRSVGVVSTVAFLTRRYGFARGFEIYDDHTAYSTEGARSAEHVSSDQVVGRAAELLDGLGGGPFFLFAHFYDAHTDYRPPEPFDAMFRPGPLPGVDATAPGLQRAQIDSARYDGELRWLDSRLGLLLAELERRGLEETTLVAITADHGEEFLEHGQRFHGRNLYDTTLRVPLLVRFPGGAHAGRRVEAPVSVVDLGATLLAAAGGGGSAWHSGRDLAGLLATEPDPGLLDRELSALGKSGGGGLVTALLADGRKVVARADRAGRPKKGPLTVLATASDPAERTPERLGPRAESRLRRRLEAAWRGQRERARRAGAPAPGAADEDRASLRALGYL